VARVARVARSLASVSNAELVPFGFPHPFPPPMMNAIRKIEKKSQSKKKRQKISAQRSNSLACSLNK
jgi:hypothetical protein